MFLQTQNGLENGQTYIVLCIIFYKNVDIATPNSPLNQI